MHPDFFEFDSINDSLEQLQNGKVILSGVGKSGNIAGKIAASFTSTGIPAIYLNPVDASHGDMGQITSHDVVILISLRIVHLPH